MCYSVFYLWSMCSRYWLWQWLGKVLMRVQVNVIMNGLGMKGWQCQTGKKQSTSMHQATQSRWHENTWEEIHLCITFNGILVTWQLHIHNIAMSPWCSCINCPPSSHIWSYVIAQTVLILLTKYLFQCLAGTPLPNESASHGVPASTHFSLLSHSMAKWCQRINAIHTACNYEAHPL